MENHKNINNESTVKPFFGQFPAPATTETTQQNVMSEASTRSDDPGNVTKPIGDHNKSMRDLKMTDINSSMSNLNLGKKTASMMSIDQEGTHEDDQGSSSENRPVRRKSTLILTEDAENELIQARKSHNSHPQESSSSSQTIDNSNSGGDAVKPKLFPVEIKWIQGGSKVYVTGSFTGWTKMIKMKKVNEDDKEYIIRLNLPIGTHRFRFVVDNELRFSDYLPTATDSRGNFVNYIEILSEEEQPVDDNNNNIQPPQEIPQQAGLDDANLAKLKQIQENQQILQENLTPEQRAKLQQKSMANKDSRLGLTQDDDDMGNGYTRFHEKSMINNAKAAAAKRDYTYTSTIPAIFIDPQAMERYYLTLDQQHRQSGNNQWLIPPALPPHLDHVILNNQQQNSSEAGSFNKEINAGGSLPIPNHVILNHLATTSIKHNTLAVATTVRYKRKYLTQILYAPIQ
ncbi:Gal83 protein [Saccharomycopsis crataegensis]|uniref:Gal83 protein n=1 Tax=Saccharomycopsis crataegensis TaxID=43959 RepID=A0AAV5QKK1_9ASCO|nr:Gal83 protein [Saccharomycopsis crataegensis]